MHTPFIRLQRKCGKIITLGGSTKHEKQQQKSENQKQQHKPKKCQLTKLYEWKATLSLKTGISMKMIMHTKSPAQLDVKAIRAVIRHFPFISAFFSESLYLAIGCVCVCTFHLLAAVITRSQMFYFCLVTLGVAALLFHCSAVLRCRKQHFRMQFVHLPSFAYSFLCIDSFAFARHAHFA